MTSFLHRFLEKHKLPDEFFQVAEYCYQPIADQLYQRLGDAPFVLGINGAQGTGKSTLADFIADYLREARGCQVVSLSIDDIYLTKSEREALAKNIHPLFATRGVPGTHDVQLGLSTINKLKMLADGETMLIPRFNKAKDDRSSEGEWTEVSGPVDLIVLEGWCVGSVPEDIHSLKYPINPLEANEDQQGKWRQYANRQLSESYSELFAEIDALILLKAPSFECVYNWRLEQENKLALSLAAVTGNDDVSGIMNEAQIARFIQHYERLTRHNLATLPSKAQAVIRLGENHQVENFTSELNP